MAAPDDLLKIDGVAAAGEFSADGKLIDYKAKMDMSPELAAASRAPAAGSRGGRERP